MKIGKPLTVLLLSALLTVPQAAFGQSKEQLPFADIKGHWAKQSILHVYNEGIMMGVGNTNRFEPNRLMTRGEWMVLLDRLYYRGEEQLFPLTHVTDQDLYGYGEGFERPYLPYRDVDRMTWAYDSVLRVHVLMENMFGPNALQDIFPGKEFRLNQPITRKEVNKTLQLFSGDGNLDLSRMKNWLQGSEAGYLKRSEAAVLAERVMDEQDAEAVLPLLDAEGRKYPILPEVSNRFPFSELPDNTLTPQEKSYYDAVSALLYSEEEEEADKAFETLKKLAETPFSLKSGVYYYLSFNPNDDFADSFQYAKQALEEYLKATNGDPESFHAIVDQVYHLALEAAQESNKTLDEAYALFVETAVSSKLSSHERTVLAYYLAALEIKQGKTQEAIRRYQSLPGEKDAILNGLHYLVINGDMDEAYKWYVLQKNGTWAKQNPVLIRALDSEFQHLQKQDEYVKQLENAMEALNGYPVYTAEGEAVLNGTPVKYTEKRDTIHHTSHTTGYFHSPEKLVAEKMEIYGDQSHLYSYDFDRQIWLKHTETDYQYAFDWVEQLSIRERQEKLGARFHLQQSGKYDVVTEWIPRERLLQEIRTISLPFGQLKYVPFYSVKYVIERKSGMLVKRLWHFEEIYQNRGQYVFYTGQELYRKAAESSIVIPQQILQEAVGTE